MNIKNWLFGPTKPKRPTPLYKMYKNTYHEDSKGFSNTYVGYYWSLEDAREYALSEFAKNSGSNNRYVQSFDLYDEFSMTNSGYPEDNWEITPNTKQWTYYKEEKASGALLYNEKGVWVGWQK